MSYKNGKIYREACQVIEFNNGRKLWALKSQAEQQSRHYTCLENRYASLAR